MNEMSLSDKSLQILELPEILDLLADQAVSEPAKGAALALRPFTNPEIVKANLSETSAAKTMMVLRQSPPFSGVKDIRAIVRRADMGGGLNLRELLDVSELLRASSSSISYFNNDKTSDETAIDYLFNALRPDKPLRERIESVIISEEEISDNASAELSGIRRHMRLAEEKIHHTLNKIISSQTYAKALQEPIITMRNNRYVVPVKVEHKQSVPGMVHDISSSGATHFIEPMTVVNLNNDLRELAAQEAEEIQRILMELSARVAGSAEILISDFEVLTKLDFIFAKAKLSYSMDATEPVLSDDKKIIFNKARHPLLSKTEAVPIDIHLGSEFDTLIITGPNTGGKTVTLKTLGLLCAMSACGLHIPSGHGCTVPVFDYILSDIGDEQSIEQSLSTFSSHMKNIVSILQPATENSLLLFDELGAGTDPVEGAALAISIIEHARQSKALIAATTHYAELKEYALCTKGVMNASCEFDIETLKPTYKLIIGIPGKSNAFAISKQLGLPDEIIEDAKSRVSTENAAFEDTLRSLEDTRLSFEKQKEEAEALYNAAEQENAKLCRLRAELESERKKHISKAQREAEDILEQAKNTVMSVIEKARETGLRAGARENSRNLNDEKVKLLRELNEAKKTPNKTTSPESNKISDSRNIKAGDRVIINSAGTQADVIQINSDGTLSLQAGIIKVTAHIDEVTPVESAGNREIKKYIAKSEAKLRTETVKPELDIRGMTTEEAIPVMEQFLDNAKMARLGSVTVIHGKGTGVLRKAVHKSLKQDNHGIKSFRLGVYGEGEDGVTVVELR